MIEAPLFAFYLDGLERESFLNIGNYSDDSVRNVDELVWLEIEDTAFWWSSNVTGIKLNNADGSFRAVFEVEPLQGITSTGTNCVYLPTQYFWSIINMIIRGFED